MAEAEEEPEDLVLPEQEFRYLAGTTERPWDHFVGRWKAIKPILAEMLRECGTERPLRIVDLGSCTGFFSLQASHCHPEADVVAVEGSVGVGNGTVGTAGSARQILGTGAVQTHLRWIQRLGLTNCFVAPEVWDFARVNELILENRPICDVMFMLSVVHHVDGVSMQQYGCAGLSRLDGFISMLGKMLLLSQRHFIELPNRPWITAAYDAYGSARSILDAAAKASGRQWRFKGPIYSVEWFGLREVWVLEAASPMPQVNVQTCPFPLLYRGEDRDGGVPPLEDDPLGDLGALGQYDDIGDDLGGALGDPALDGDIEPLGAVGADPYLEPGLDSALGGRPPLEPEFTITPACPHIGGLSEERQRRILEPEFTITPACPHIGGSLMDPGLMTLTEPCHVAEARIGEALNTAPTALLLAHLALREAVSEACSLLDRIRSSGIVEEQQSGQLQPPGQVPLTQQALAVAGLH